MAITMMIPVIRLPPGHAKARADVTTWRKPEAIVWTRFRTLIGGKQERVAALRSRDRDDHRWSPTGWPEAVTHPRLPQNVACGFPALRSSEVASQHGDSL